jgi:hypothetical protein
MNATMTETAVPMDGQLSAPVWMTADSITDFRQREPAVGAAASERTVVKVLRDRVALYIGVRAETASHTGFARRSSGATPTCRRMTT